jgi:hypothetical protein
VEIDAVEQRTRYLTEILLDLRGRAAALARGVPEKPAPASMHVTTALLNAYAGWLYEPAQLKHCF